MTKRHPLGRRARALLVATTSLSLAAAGLGAGAAGASAEPADPTAQTLGTPAAATPQAFEDGRYVVLLDAPPATQYEGGEAGLAATAVEEGEQFDEATAAVQEYREHLRAEQRQVAAAAEVEPQQQFSLAVNGFTAELTALEAAQLAKTEGVLAVAPEQVHQPDTVSSPDFLGLTGRDGVWNRTGGRGEAGAGVVVGVLDTGVWPENPSFAGRPLRDRPSAGDPFRAYRQAGTIRMRKADGGTFVGECETGQQFTADLCSTKVVGARAYGEGFEAALQASGASIAPYEYRSPRDGDGHGSHTASTAAGNAGVPVVIDNRSWGTASGMAPAASVAAYKVCWDATTAAQTGCFTTDMVAAIEDAIADGVDVLNFSIGGGAARGITDPTDLAFLSAASAGIFVAASAGNSGPGASTHDHAAPWMTTVAASTHALYEGTVQLGTGEQFKGATTTVQGSAGPFPLVNASAVGLEGKPAQEVALCFAGSLDPAKTAGKAVVCDRGVNDRVAKSAEVRRAGGLAMVLTNTAPSSTDSDLHAVPTVHVDAPARGPIQAYAATAGATVTLREGNLTGQPTPVPQIAGFSSRGPSLAAGGDLLKPDITAPGVGVIAAVSPTNPTNAGRQWNFLSGTSMSSPHIAGLAALYLSERPDWSPMWVKSAMMTTAYDIRDATGGTVRDPFVQGAGHVDPTRFFDPGVVFGSDEEDWLSLIEGVDTTYDWADVEPVDPSDFNAPSIAIGALSGSQTVTRELTSLAPGTWRATAAVPGVDVRVTPSVLSFARAGETKRVQITFSVNASTPLDTYAKGSITWSGSKRTTARIPVAVQPQTVAAPAEVSAPDSASGSTTFEVVPGSGQAIDLTVRGLAPGTSTTGDVAVGSEVESTFTVPAGTSFGRVDLVAGLAGADLDLFLLNAAGAVVAQSATEAGSERIDVPGMPAGTYTVVVSGFSSPGGAVPYELRTFAVGDAEAGNLRVTPDPVTGAANEPVSVTATWSGLDASRPHLGWIGYGSSPTRTVVSIG